MSLELKSEPQDEPKVEVESPNLLPPLSEELIACGWSREFSRSKQKHYYFNARTGTACWSFQDLTDRTHEVTVDRKSRVAQQCGSSQGEGQTPSTDSLPAIDDSPSLGQVNLGYEDVKGHLTPAELHPGPSECLNRRRRSSASSLGPQPKQICLSSSDALWNFAIPSNCCFLRSHGHYALFGPHLELEMYRGVFYNKLRESVKNAIVKEFDINLSDCAFTRWIIEARGFDSGIEPLLPTCVNFEPDLTALKNEILYQLPVRLKRPANVHEAMLLLNMFLANTERLLQRWCKPSEHEGLLPPFWEKLRELTTCERQDVTMVMNVLHECMQQVKPVIDQKAVTVLSRLCFDALSESKGRVLWLIRDFLPKLQHEELSALLGRPDQLQNPLPLADSVIESVPDCPASMLCSELDFLPEYRPEQPKITVCPDHIEVAHETVTHSLKQVYFDKLVELYRLNTPSDPEFKLFPNRLLVLLERYRTFLNAELDDVNQAALPSSVFECLHEEFGVTFELFASPFNCYFKQFCSLFPDTDCYFGSRGPFSNFPMTKGSFQANPPFTEVFLNKVVDFVIERLRQSSDPISVAFFMPDWRDPPIEALRKLEHSPFNRNQLTFPAKHHSYRLDRAAFQFGRWCDTELRPSSHGTTLIFLQNSAGYQQWTPTPHNLKKLRQAFMDE